MNPIKNILIVESPNDAAFIRLMLEKLKIGAETDTVVIENLHKFLDEEGNERRGKTAIGEKLKNVRRDIQARYPNVEKLGIILDMDQDTLDKNLLLVNNALQLAFGTNDKLGAESKMLSVEINASRFDDKIPLQIGCFFIKDASAQGKLDSLLLEIRANPQNKVPYADCLALWRDCVNQSGGTLKVSDNNYSKMWLHHFLRANASGMGKAGKTIINDFETKQHKVIEKIGNQVFDLDHSSLNALRDFLLLFK